MKMSKILFTAMALLLGSTSLFSQVSISDTTHPSTMLFDDYKPGYVLLKSGDVQRGDLNYDAYDHNIAFKQGNQQMNLTHLEDIDTVYFAGRKFIPMKKKMYEVVEKGGSVALLIMYDARINPISATAEHTGSTRKSTNEVMSTITNTNLSRSRYQNGFEVELQRTFWLSRFSDISKATSEKNVIKAFPDHVEDSLKQYFQEHKVDLKNLDDLQALVVYANATADKK